MDPKNWPTEYVINTSSNWVEKHPRPKEGEVHGAILKTRQEQWDAAAERHKTLSERADAIRAKRETEAQEKRDAAAARDQVRQQARREADEAMLKRRFLIAGGSEAEWLAQKDQLVSDHIKTKALSGTDPGREAQAALYRRF